MKRSTKDGIELIILVVELYVLSWLAAAIF